MSKIDDGIKNEFIQILKIETQAFEYLALRLWGISDKPIPGSGRPVRLLEKYSTDDARDEFMRAKGDLIKIGGLSPKIADLFDFEVLPSREIRLIKRMFLEGNTNISNVDMQFGFHFGDSAKGGW